MNKWFQDNSNIVKQGKFGGKQVWNCIQNMQHGRKGWVPSRFITTYS